MKTRQQTSGKPLTAPSKALWKAGQIMVFLVTGLVIVGLFLKSDLTLNIVWFAVVPLLPASFLINAGLWRGICPLASMNMVANREAGFAVVGKWLTVVSIVGIVILGLLVPLRRILLNTDGSALSILLISIVVVAFVMGFVVKAKGGFCNSICPVLPVEKLYGQAPLITVRNPRCIPCTLCTSKGCLDVDPALSVKHAVGNSQDKGRWLASPFGVFASAFPGFIFGYFQLANGDLASAGHVYQTVFLYAGLSLVLVGVTSYFLHVPSPFMLPFLGAFSFGLYYWFSIPASFLAFNLPGSSIARFLMMAFVGYWLAKALQSAATSSAPPASHKKRHHSVVAASLPQ